MDEIERAIEAAGGIITVTDEDLEAISLPTIKTVELAGFIREADVDPLYYSKPYYLLPDGRSYTPYWLLYNALKKSKKAGIARFSTHGREHLALVRPANKVLTLNSLYYPEEIREVDEKNLSPVRADQKHLELALSFIDQQTVDFDPSLYNDRYKEALEKMIGAKKPEPLPAAGKQGQVLDLLEALRKSVEKGKEKQKPA